MTAPVDPLPVILVVDDDPVARAALLEAADRPYGHDYDVTAEGSAAEALARLLESLAPPRSCPARSLRASLNELLAPVR
jgi:hypothetical protein